MWRQIVLFIISVFLMTISAMYISAVNSCKDKDSTLIVYDSTSMKFAVILLIIAISFILFCFWQLFKSFTSPEKVL
jgi:hypothetical protein